MPQTQKQPSRPLQFSADVAVTSNGTAAQTAKVSIVARSNSPVSYPPFGNMVHDFSGMTAKSRIPLDWEHEDDGSNGYLNNFDTSSGQLVCSGAIVIADDETQQLVTLLGNGVPYEASIQHDFDDSTVLELIPEGETTQVNGVTLSGPLTVVREWQLKAVAICKFGVDSDTSVDLMMSEAKAKQSRGLFVRLSKQLSGETKMSNKIDPAVETAKTVDAPVEAVAKVPAVEADAKVEGVVLSEKPAVESNKLDVETPKDVVAEVAQVAPEVITMSKASDTRSEFKQFVAAFGGEKAALYFSEGMSLHDASIKFSAEARAEIEDLKLRLSAVDRGAAKPVKLSKAPDDVETVVKPQGLKSVIKMASDRHKK